MNKNRANPTLFVLDGTIRVYDDGNMLELYTNITIEEWKEIVSETIKYKVFVDCLEEIAIPILDEEWTKSDKWFQRQLEVSVSRMRNIDPMLVAQYDQNKIKKTYSEAIESNAKAMAEYIKQIRDDTQQIRDSGPTQVSDL